MYSDPNLVGTCIPCLMYSDPNLVGTCIPFSTDPLGLLCSLQWKYNLFAGIYMFVCTGVHMFCEQLNTLVLRTGIHLFHVQGSSCLMNSKPLVLCTGILLFYVQGSSCFMYRDPLVLCTAILLF